MKVFSELHWNPVYQLAVSHRFSFNTPVSETQAKLDRFRSLKAGWSYGEGLRIEEVIIHTAEKLLGYLLARCMVTTDVFPGLNGEVRLTAYSGDDYLEFTVEPNGRITFVHELDGKEIKFEEDLTLVAAVSRAEKATEGRACFLGSSIPHTMIKSYEDFRALHLETPQTAPAFLWLTRLVSSDSPTRYVNTSEYTMDRSPDN